MTRIAPLPSDTHVELDGAFDVYRKAMGFIPNSLLIMQRRPKMVKAFSLLTSSIWDPESTVNVGFKRLIGHFVSRVNGCQYCMAHNAGAALHQGIDALKLESIWEYKTSPHFTPAERVALDFALAAVAVPNAVDDALMDQMKAHWSDEDIIEIVGVVSLFGFMNRWNDTFATPLEEEPAAVGVKHLAKSGWAIGKHG